MARIDCLLSLCLIILLGFTGCDRIKPGDPIDVPDESFLNALIGEGIDSNDDGEISVEEAEAVTYLDVSFQEDGWGINSLKGIEWFVNLEYLDCNYNNLRFLDFSSNRLLKELHCAFNGLRHLDISRNTALEILDCSGNSDILDCPTCGLKNLEISDLIHLKELYCYGCLLTSLEVSHLGSLEVLCCGNPGIMNLDLSTNKALTTLAILNSDISSLNLSHNTALTKVELLGNNALTDLEISSLRDLGELRCDDSPISSLDVSQNGKLKILSCYSNQLSNLDVTNNTSLEVLIFQHNQLSTIDVSNNSKLIALNGSNNQLTVLNLVNNPSMEYLYLAGMPSLHEVCVWTTPFPPEDFRLDTIGSPNLYFTTDCSQLKKIFAE